MMSDIAVHSFYFIRLGQTGVNDSNQAPLRHIEGVTYRCFLPDLTGVHDLPLRKTRLSSPTTPACPKRIKPWAGSRSHLSELQRPRLCILIWRRERDSNPRYSFPYTRFPGVLLQPLGHLSGMKMIQLFIFNDALETYPCSSTARDILPRPLSFVNNYSHL
jgi:hypothetical protein